MKCECIDHGDGTVTLCKLHDLDQIDAEPQWLAKSHKENTTAAKYVIWAVCIGALAYVVKLCIDNPYILQTWDK